MQVKLSAGYVHNQFGWRYCPWCINENHKVCNQSVSATSWIHKHIVGHNSIGNTYHYSKPCNYTMYIYPKTNARHIPLQRSAIFRWIEQFVTKDPTTILATSWHRITPVYRLYFDKSQLVWKMHCVAHTPGQQNKNRILRKYSYIKSKVF